VVVTVSRSIRAPAVSRASFRPKCSIQPRRRSVQLQRLNRAANESAGVLGQAG
jgi:hypothetical protein